MTPDRFSEITRFWQRPDRGSPFGIADLLCEIEQENAALFFAESCMAAVDGADCAAPAAVLLQDDPPQCGTYAAYCKEHAAELTPARLIWRLDGA